MSAPRMTAAEALKEVGLVARGEPVAVGLLSNEERESILRALNDFGTSERLWALDTLEALIERAERDSQLLNGRDHDEERFNEAIGLIALLRARESAAAGVHGEEHG